MPLDRIVARSDHVLVARVARVDMVDGRGRPVRDRDARTGPGLDNQIRFHLDVEEVLMTSCKRQPRQVVVPLWQAWHYTLGGMQDQVEGNTGVFLLEGAQFQPAYPNGFQRGMAEHRDIQRLVDAERLRRKPSQVDCNEAPNVP